MDRDPFTDQGALLLAESDGCAVWQFHGRGGEGTMTVYQVLPGVMLSFNDFHMDCFESSFVPGRRMLAIDHCREGRMEDSPRGRPSGLYRGGGREAGPPAGPHRDLNIADIGCAVGYDNPGKFTEVFKRSMGMTPSEYRKERGIRYEI